MIDLQENLEVENKDIQSVFDRQKERAISLRSTTAQVRVTKLKALKEWLAEHRFDLQKALFADFQKPASETDLTEYYLVKAEIDMAIRHLSGWMEPKRVGTPLPLIGSRSSILMEPKGVCLIIGPWNYPFSLVIGPLVSAIAAGNTVILKPSEIAENTSAFIKKMAESLFEPEEIKVIEGGVDVATELLALPFDHIFFTGSPRVGKIVMKAASEHLTSVTLELGGKTPNIIDETANIDDAVEKIVFNKFLNAGQTCIAPDYMLVQQAIHDRFVTTLVKRIKEVYASHEGDLAGIISEKHLNHLKVLTEDAIEKGAKFEYGGQLDFESCRMEPTVVSNVSEEMKVMQDEIFGPLIPVLAYNHLDEALEMVNNRPKPLALYFYSRSVRNKKRVLKETSSGGVCINDGNIQFSNNHLPFGGVNHSGVGKGHGYYGFRTFSNEKAVLKQRIGMTSVKLLYPPYTKRVKKIIELLLRWL